MRTVYEIQNNENGDTHYRERYEYSPYLKTYLLIGNCPTTCSASFNYIDMTYVCNPKNQQVYEEVLEDFPRPD